MFTGLIRHRGVLKNSYETKGLLTLEIENFELSQSSAPKDSISVNGICLTISEIKNDLMKFELVAETQNRTTAVDWKVEQVLHLEPAMRLSDRLDGHLVTGHIDTTVPLRKKQQQNDSLILYFQVPNTWAGLIIEKGSITIDGVSLTVANIEESNEGSVIFSCWLIPTTLENTIFSELEVGNKVNLEFDLLAKYIQNNLKRARFES